MRKRPKILAWLACGLLAIAVGLPLQIMLAYGHAPWELEAIAAKLAPLNWILLALAPISAALVIRAAPALRIAMPLLSAAVIYNNYLVAQTQGPYSWMAVALSTTAFLGMVSLLCFGSAGEVIADPSLRWWLTAQRHRHEVEVRLRFLERGIDERKRAFLSSLDLIHAGFVPPGIDQDPEFLQAPSGQGDFTLRTYDLSESGAFILLDTKEGAYRRIRTGSRCYMVIPLGSQEKLICQAEIVRETQACGQYPAGIGIKFLHLSWLAQRRISTYLQQLTEQKLATRSAPGPDQLAA